MVFGDDGLPKTYHPLVGCPVCRQICWLSHVTEIGTDDPDTDTDGETETETE
jgi:hypothetical protein